MLTIRKVVLYKHGVGYFERQGTVSGDAALDLHFRASEMNDVLKSLTTLDLTSGHIASISYESTTPLAKQLEDIAIRLPDQNAVSGLLGEIKGARLAVEVAGERVEGIASGIETVRKEVESGIVETKRLALLVDGFALRTFDLGEVARVEFLDEGLRKDLEHLLQVLIDAKRKDLKRLTVFAQGAGEREILASYIVETPVWKTSYRLLLGGEKPVIQGWALVDNTQDEDWVDVELSLVAGLPISFVHDLYSPRYKRRPVVEVSEEEAYAPPMLEDAVWDAALDEREMGTGMAVADAVPEPMRRARGRLAEKSMMLEQRAEARDRSVRVQTRTVEIGDLFEYAIENPVTVKRNQSALVPILQGPFDGERVCVYNREVREKNPLSAILFHNTTGLTLEGGPLTVLEGDAYVGESMLETLKPDEKRLVPYSVELSCVVTVDHRSRRQDVRAAKIVDGVLTLRRYRVEQTIYVVANRGDEALDLFLEHGFRRGWDLVDTPEPVETTENFYRFRFAAEPGKATRFVVSEKGDEAETFALLDADRDAIALWLTKGWIDRAAGDVLDRVLALRTQAADLDRRLAEHGRRIQAIVEDQGRQRENLKALGTSQQEQGLREKYVAALSDGEEDLSTLRDEVARWTAQRREVEKELRQRVAGLAFETTLGG